MDALTLKVNLDCLRKDSQAIINAKVGEANGRKVVFTLYEGRTAFFVPAEASAIFRAQKPDGTILYNHCVIDDGKVEYTITSQTVAVAGVYACELQIVSGGRIIYSPYVTLNVTDNLYSDTEVESSDEYTELDEALKKIPSLEVINSKYTKPEGGIPKADLSEDVRASLDKADTALQEHQSLAAYRTAAEQDAIDATKQDKLTAGDNITISEDGTISATGGGNGLGYLPVKLTDIQSSGSNFTCTADKTFDEVEAATSDGKALMSVDMPDGFAMCALVESGTSAATGKRWMEFVGLYIEHIIVNIRVYSDESWELQFSDYTTSGELSAVQQQIGALVNLSTTDKSTVVAAINEVKSDVPTKTSQLENDSGYLTLDTLPKYGGAVE